MKKSAGILTKEEQARRNRLFFDYLGKDGGVEIITILESKFQKRSMVKRLADGSVDMNATLVQCGAYDLLSYITQSIELGAKGE
jgi:hypothetical protein